MRFLLPHKKTLAAPLLQEICKLFLSEELFIGMQAGPITNM